MDKCIKLCRYCQATLTILTLDYNATNLNNELTRFSYFTDERGPMCPDKQSPRRTYRMPPIAAPKKGSWVMGNIQLTGCPHRLYRVSEVNATYDEVMLECGLCAKPGVIDVRSFDMIMPADRKAFDSAIAELRIQNPESSRITLIEAARQQHTNQPPS